MSAAALAVLVGTKGKHATCMIENHRVVGTGSNCDDAGLSVGDWCEADADDCPAGANANNCGSGGDYDILVVIGPAPQLRSAFACVERYCEVNFSTTCSGETTSCGWFQERSG